MEESNLLGAWGEFKAGEYLRKKRYRLEAVGYSCRFGEIDIIACNRKNIVFVEVKLRKSDAFAQAMEYVDTNKQERLRKTSEIYLSEFPSKLKSRFDVIEIYAPNGIETENVVIHHLENAFE
jgi:putative endonuclease